MLAHDFVIPSRVSMSQLKKSQTITTKIQPPFGEEFQIAAILPTEKPIINKRTTVPISLFLSKSGTDTNLGCYIYSIKDKNEDIHQTILNNSEEDLMDFTKKIGKLVSKKFSVPSYVCISGNWSLEELITTIKYIVEFIEDSF